MSIFKKKRYKLKPYISHRDIVKRRRRRVVISLIILVAIIIIGFLVFSNKESWKADFLQGTTTNDINDSYSLVGYTKQPKRETGIHKKEDVPIKGVYVSGNMAGSNNVSDIIDMCKRTELNALVIDAKSDLGDLTFSVDNNIIKEAGIIPDRVPIKNIDYLIEQLYLNNIYPIARIVTFKDNMIKEKHPDYMIKNKDGTFYESDEPGNQKATWLNPYNKDTWEYILNIGKEVAKLGFKEIQLDYVRFHEGVNSDSVNLGSDSIDKDKTQIINEFIKYIVDELHKEKVKVSADVFGAIITSEFDAKVVGQDYVELSKHLDYISPMVYPSHYAKDSFGVESPDLDPYSIILGSMLASKERLKSIKEEESVAIVRPWLQDFTASWISVHKEYGPNEIREQIDGVYDAGLDEWLLWNAANNYTEEGLLAK